MTRDVSVKAISISLASLRKRGIDEDALFAGLGFTRDDLRDTGGYLDWDDVAEFADRACAQLGGIAQYEAWVSALVGPSEAFGRVASLVLPIRSVYYLMLERFTRAMYPCLGIRVEDTTDGRLAFSITIPRHRRGCVPFFRASFVPMRSYPRLLGLPDATVVGDSSAHHLAGFITLPPDRHLLARAQRLVPGLAEITRHTPSPSDHGAAPFSLLVFDDSPLLAEATAVGQRLATERTLAGLGEALLAHLRVRCNAEYLALWAERPDGAGQRLVFTAGTPSRRIVSRPLLVAAASVGRLDTDLAVLAEAGGSPYLEALLPWISLGLSLCAAGPAPERSPQIPQRRDEARARAALWGRAWGLTPRQQETLERLACGLGNKDIAEGLGVGLKAVEKLVAVIFDKAGTGSRGELIARFWSAPIVEGAAPTG